MRKNDEIGYGSFVEKELRRVVAIKLSVNQGRFREESVFFGGRRDTPTPTHSTFYPGSWDIFGIWHNIPVASDRSRLDLWQSYSHARTGDAASVVSVRRLWWIQFWKLNCGASREPRTESSLRDGITYNGNRAVISQSTKNRQSNKWHGTINTARRCWVNCAEGYSLTRRKYRIMTDWQGVISARGTSNKQANKSKTRQFKAPLKNAKRGI